MWKTFVGEEFRCEHGEERTEEECVYDETEIAIVVAQTTIEESEKTEENQAEPRKEECSDDRIEDGIGRIVVSPVLVTEECVLDERCRESFDESAWKIAMIHFRREDGDMSGARFEVFGVGDEEVIQHRSSRDEGAQNEGEPMLPEALEEMFIREKQCRQKKDEDERCDTEGDVGMESKAEDESGPEEVELFLRAKATEEKEEGEREEKGCHDGAETDT